MKEITLKVHTNQEMPPKDKPLFCLGNRGSWFIGKFDYYDETTQKMWFDNCITAREAKIWVDPKEIIANDGD